MREVVITAGSRTPIGRFGGIFKDTDPSYLGSVAIRSSLERAGIDFSEVDEVIMGNVIQSSSMGYLARTSAIKAGLPVETPAITVNRACASGLEAINIAAYTIMSGDADVIIAGGVESMSTVPYFLPKARFGGLRYGDGVLIDGVKLGLSCPIYDYQMGVTAENIADTYEISRADQDKLAVNSHLRAVDAQENGYFNAQIEPVIIQSNSSDQIIHKLDEHPRADTDFSKLSALNPVFRETGSVTAGNSAGMNDAAAAVVVMSAEYAKTHSLVPKMRWVGRSVSGVDPQIMGTGPVPAVRKLLAKTSMSLGDIDLIELNEAFAAQALHVIRELNLDESITNVNGSGISLGHPLGATGAIMVIKLMYELERRDTQFGLATLCVGGGQGVATIFERLN